MKNALVQSTKLSNTNIRTTRATPVQLFLAELTTAQIADMVAQLFAQHASLHASSPVSPARPVRPIKPARKAKRAARPSRVKQMKSKA